MMLVESSGPVGCPREYESGDKFTLKEQHRWDYYNQELLAFLECTSPPWFIGRSTEKSRWAVGLGVTVMRI